MALIVTATARKFLCHISGIAKAVFHAIHAESSAEEALFVAGSYSVGMKAAVIFGNCTRPRIMRNPRDVGSLEEFSNFSDFHPTSSRYFRGNHRVQHHSLSNI
jgi:hypothetical protein